MTPELTFIPFRSAADKGWAEAEHLYDISFPYKECRSMEEHMRALTDPRFEACGIWRGEEFVGIFYYWNVGNGWHYGEHLAIQPELRGENLGSIALAAFCREIGNIVLEIDPPVDEISIRRRGFYQRSGFVENPHEYLHPSFRQPFETHKLVLMSYPRLMTDVEAREFADFVREVVLEYSEHEELTLPKLP